MKRYVKASITKGEMTPLGVSDLQVQLPEGIELLDKGAQDLENKGVSGYYTWVCYRQPKNAEDKKALISLMEDVAYDDILPAMMKYANVQSRAAINWDYPDDSDMARLWVATDNFWEEDISTIIKMANIENPIAKSHSSDKYMEGLRLVLWDGNQCVTDCHGYHVHVKSIPEGEPAYKTTLKLKCVDKMYETTAVFKDNKGRIYYYRVANPNASNRIYRALDVGKTYELSCKVVDIPDGVAANGITYAFKCSWILSIYNTGKLKEVLEDYDKMNRQFMSMFYGPNRREFFDDDLIK